MTKEMKRPTSHISGNSIKPALSKAVEFYTDNNRQAYECIHERDEYIDYLESKLSNARPQQALPVVPECVAEWLESNNLTSLLDEWYCHHEDMSSHIREYFERLPYKGPNNLSEMENNIVTFITRAKLGGYKLEKPQLFYLREKNTNYYLNKSKNNGLELVPNPYFDEDNQFTQQKIDSMQTGSYEQIPVPVEDNK